MENLPEDLILPILKLLPVKSLIRFKCVCKSWFSLISDPHFAKSHFELAAAPTHHRLLLHQCVTVVHPPLTLSIDLDAPSLYSDSAVLPLHPSFLPPETRSRVMGSCRGFILFQNTSRHYGRKDLYLWNPSTGLHKQLPLSSSIPLSEGGPLTYLHHLYGFGFDPSTDDYLVLRPHWGLFKIKYFEMFSVRNNKWNTYGATNLPRYMPLMSHFSYTGVSYEEAQPGMLFNGVLHWLVFRIDDRLNVILAFDLTKRTFSDIPLPFHLSRRSNLCVLGGLLGLCIPIDGEVQIWAMQQYKEPTSWTMFAVVHYNDLINATGYGFSPICSTKSGDIVGIHGSRLVKCDGNGQLLDHRPSYYAEIRFRYAAEVAIYQESLLSLPVVNGQVAEDGQHE